MQIVPQEVSTKTATMPIINAEIRATRPLICSDIGPRLRWQQISDYRHPILIIGTDEALVRIGSVGTHNTSAFVRSLGRVVIRNYYLVCRLNSQATLIMHIDALHIG